MSAASDEDSDSNEDYITEVDQSITDRDQDNAIVSAEGWKSAFQLPFEPVWFNFLLITNYISIIMAVYRSFFETHKPMSTAILAELRVFNNLHMLIYTIDIFLRFFMNIFHDLRLDPLGLHIPTGILLLDVISLIPIKSFIPLNTSSKISIKLRNLAGLHPCLGMLRISFVFHRYHNMVGIPKIPLQIIEFVFYLSIAIMFGFGLSYNIQCFPDKCEEPLPLKNHTKYFLEAISKITSRGFAEYPDNLLWMTLFSLLSYMVSCLILTVSMSYLTIAFFTYLQRNRGHTSELPLIYEEIERSNPTKELKNRCINFYDIFCNKRKGYDNREVFLTLLPGIMFEDICLDISWITFKHSKLFRQMDRPFLFHLAGYIKPKFLLPGELLFDKGMLKTAMVYIVSGVVQILSEEDGETPILSFSGGTCFGEIGLMMSCESSIVVRCKTFCSLQVLEKQDFIRSVKMFPREYRKVLRLFRDRLHEAQNTCKVQKAMTEVADIEKSQALIIMWLKNTLHRLMMKDGDTSRKHECRNIHLRNQFNENRFSDCIFVADNLDLLVISERLELVTDSVFLKTSCPCIIQPDSVVVSLWEIIIVILAAYTSFLVPYYAFVEPSTPLWFQVHIYIITLVWWLDLYFQVSIGVKTANEILANVKTILFYKLGTLGFLLDIVSAIPMEIYSCLILYKVTGQYHAVLQLNRVIKLWRVYNACTKWENKINANVVLARRVTYSWVFLYIVYFESCLLYAMNCFDFVCIEENIRDSVVIQLFWDMMEAIQILTGTNMVSILTNHAFYHNAYICFIMVSIGFHIFVFSNIAAAQALCRYRRMRVEETYTDMTAITRANNLSHKYDSKIDKYVKTKWDWNQGVMLTETKALLSDLPKNLYGELKNAHHSKILSNVPIFQQLPEDVIFNVCSVVKEILLPPNEVICQTGNIIRSFYVIVNGHCNLVSNISGVMNRSLGPLDTFAVLEACMGIPAVNTVITTTHCQLLVFNRKYLSSIYSKYHEHADELQQILDETNMKTKLLPLIRASAREDKYAGQLFSEELEKRSFHKFGYHLRVDSPEEFDYYNPFDRMNFLQCVQYVLMRYTIKPEGQFLYYWEISRCICAVMSSILFPFTSIGVSIDSEWIVFLLFLDLMAWIDIYVKLHICYYDKKGILVTHPLKTAKHYLQHSFIIDLIAVFPMQIFFLKSSLDYNGTLALCQLNRVLQMYRYIGFWRASQANTFYSSVVKLLLLYFPVGLVLCFSFGSILININCKFGYIEPENDEIFTYGVDCWKDSWIAVSNFHKPLNPTRVQAYGVYFATSVLTGSGMLGYSVDTEFIGIIMTILSIVGFCFACHLFCSTVAHFTSGNSALLDYQDSIKSCRSFMTNFKVAYELQQKFIAHFELKWHRKRGKNIHESLKKFSRSFQYDILYDVYGHILQDSSEFFSADSGTFLRNLLVEVSHDVCINQERLISINDVVDVLYVLLKGRVNVLAPDGTKLVSLTPGSMFGNLDNSELSRQTITVEAVGHIEYLIINSRNFYKILDNYPQLRVKYKSLTTVHVDYLPGRGRVVMEDESSQKHSSSIMSSIRLFNTGPIHSIRYKVFNLGSPWLNIWKTFVLFGVCYFELYLESYQLAMLEFSPLFIAFQYFCDLSYLINYYVLRHTEYENEIGIMIRDLDLIARNLTQQKFTTLLFIAAVPLDAVAFALPKSVFHIVFRLLRVNRLLRIFYTLVYYQKQHMKLNINIYLLRLTYIFLTSNFVLHLATCLLIALGCTHRPNLHPEIKCNRLDLTSWEKLQEYCRFWFAVVSCYTGSSQNLIYPHSLLLTFYFVLLMLVLRIMMVTVIGCVYSTLQMGFNRQNDFAIRISRMRDFMEIEDVSHGLVNSAWLYLRLLWLNQRGTTFPSLLEEAPSFLNELVLNSAFAHHINTNFIFSKCHVDFNRQVVACLRNTTFLDNEYIVFRGSLSRSMFFVHSGSVMALKQNEDYSEEPLAILEAGRAFGVTQGLFPKKPHTRMFRCVTQSVVLTLKYDTWCHLLDIFPASKVMIYDKYKKYQETTQWEMIQTTTV